MQLPLGGIDIYYIDESIDTDTFVMSAVAVPFIRRVDDNWSIVWNDHFDQMREWKRNLWHDYEIPVQKELKGGKLASGRGRYLRGKHQLQRPEASTVYRAALSSLGFIQSLGIITVVGSYNSNLYGHSRLEAVLYALLQRMRTACKKTQKVGMVFFDEGHGEYRKLYRKALVHLPTGSNRGDWGDGAASKSIPLDNFVKDANTKSSTHSLYTQVADMISYAALLKIRGEQRKLPEWQRELELHTLYDAIPKNSLNVMASTKDPQGIVRLG
jgi:hypothetical protein